MEKDKKIFNTLFQEFIFIRSYSRWNSVLSRRETWKETVTRYCEYMKKNFGDKISTKEFNDVFDAIYNLEVMPSMRALWAAGKAADADNFSMYNCAFTTIEKLKDFSEVLYILMNGTGVGYSVERKFINKLPMIKEKNGKKKEIIVFADSKAGWAKGVEQVMQCLWEGQEFDCDYSSIRPRGARLKTFGGRASGPGPLKDLVSFVSEIVDRNRGFQIRPIDAHDILCKIAEVVVVGGVRRSACISLSDLTDNEMANAKTGEFWNTHPQRQLSNNSVAYTRTPDLLSFIDEWKNLYRSKSGERGIFSRFAAQKKANENGRRDGSKITGCNPCFAGYEELLTTDGYRTFEELDGTEPDLINADGEVVKGKVWKSGTKKTVEVKLSNNLTFVCTPDHIFKLNDGTESEATGLKGKRLKAHIYKQSPLVEDDLFVKLGFIQGDGNTTRLLSRYHKGLEVNIGQHDKNIAELFDYKDFFNENLSVGKRRKFYTSEYTKLLKEIKMSTKKLPERFLPAKYFSTFTKEQRMSFLKGLFSANGSVISNYRIALKSTCWNLVNDVKNSLLWDFKISTYITTNKAKEVKFSNGDYVCKESYDLNIGGFEDIRSFYELIGFVQDYKMDKLRHLLKEKSPIVVSVKEGDEIDVYDFNEPKTNWGVVNGYVVHNCGEVLLRSKSLCNLTEVVVKPEDDFESLKKKVKVATLLGTWQSTFTKFKFVDKEWKMNCEEERLLGVSLTGLRDHKILGSVNDTAKKWLADLKHVAIQSNKKVSSKIGINRAAAITTVKPSGTVSLLVGSSPGAHVRPTETGYYLRRVRISATDSLYELFKDAGFPMKCENGQTPDNCSTWVLEFPSQAPKGTKLKGDETAQDQLEYWKMLRNFWTEHNPSITINVCEEEWLHTAAWVYKNFDEVGGLTFLPFSDHVYPLAPYEDIDRETYEKLIKALPEISFSKLTDYENNDQTEGAKELACTGDSCEIK